MKKTKIILPLFLVFTFIFSAVMGALLLKERDSLLKSIKEKEFQAEV